MKTIKILLLVSILAVTQSFAFSKTQRNVLLGLGAGAIIIHALESRNDYRNDRPYRETVYVDYPRETVYVNSRHPHKKHKKQHMKNKHNRDHHRYARANRHDRYDRNNHQRYDNKSYRKHYGKYNSLAVNDNYKRCDSRY